MKQTIKTILFSCLFLSFLTTYAVTFTNPNKPLQVTAANPTFTIRMASNPTTGYSWILKKYNKHYLKLIDHHYVKPQQAMPGAGGYEEWNFKVSPLAFKKSTSIKLNMFYSRPWEKNFVKKVQFRIMT